MTVFERIRPNNSQETGLETAASGVTFTGDEALRLLVTERYPTLDHVRTDSELGERLGLRVNDQQDAHLIARELIARGLLAPVPPDDHLKAITKQSLYCMPEVVGAEHARSNQDAAIRYYLRERGIQNLDDVVEDYRFGGLLQLEGDARQKPKSIAQRLVEFGYISPQLPENQKATVNTRRSYYIDSAIVGNERAEANTLALVQRALTQKPLRHLDELKNHPEICLLLGDNSRTKAAARLVELELMATDYPESHPNEVPDKLSMYLNPDVVGVEKAERNRSLAIETILARCPVRSIEGLSHEHRYALGKLLGLPEEDKRVLKTIAKALIAQEYLFPDKTDGAMSKRPRDALAYRADVVGHDAFRMNCAKAVREYLSDNKITNLDQVTLDQSVAMWLSAFGDRPTRVNSMIQSLVSNGFLSGSIPPNHSLWNGDEITRYVDSELVGIPLALENRVKAAGQFLAAHGLSNLDQVDKDHARRLATIFGRDKVTTKGDVLKKLLETNLLSPHIPPGAPLSLGNRASCYCDPKIVGERQVLENILTGAQLFVETARISSLDQVGLNYGIAAAVGVPAEERKSKGGLAKRLVQLGVLAAEIDPRLLPHTNPFTTVYTDPRVVGAEVAQGNKAKLENFFAQHENPFLKKMVRTHDQRRQTYRERRNIRAGDIYYDSTDEVACAEAFRRFIPGWEPKEGITYQVAAGLFRFDFRINDILLEYHPILLLWAKGGLGDFPSEDSYRKFLELQQRAPPGEERKKLHAKYVAELGHAYLERRKVIAAQHGTTSNCTVLWANTPGSVFDQVLVKFNVPLTREEFILEFNRRRRELWQEAKIRRQDLRASDKM